MENSRTGMVIMALPLVILILALVIALYTVGFDMEAATLPENPVEPLEETLSSLLQAEGPLVAGSAVESDPATGMVTLTGSVQNPTAYPLTVQEIEYRVPAGEEEFITSLPAPVIVPPGGSVEVVLTGAATPDAAIALQSGREKGMLSVNIEIMGISITTEMPRTWMVGA